MNQILKITTDEAAGLFWHEVTFEAQEVQDCMHVVQYYPELTYQTMEGFGGAFTESASHNFAQMNALAQQNMLTAYFGKSGLGYTLGRLSMNSCDFAMASTLPATSDAHGQSSSARSCSGLFGESRPGATS